MKGQERQERQSTCSRRIYSLDIAMSQAMKQSGERVGFGGSLRKAAFEQLEARSCSQLLTPLPKGKPKLQVKDKQTGC